MNNRTERDEVNRGWIEGKINIPKRDKTHYSNRMRFDVVVLGMHWSGSSAITRADGDMKLLLSPPKRWAEG